MVFACTENLGEKVIHMDMGVIPVVFLSVYGLYLTVAACVPFDFVTILSRSNIQIKALDSRKARFSTLLSGIFLIAGAIALGLLFYGAQLSNQLHR